MLDRKRIGLKEFNPTRMPAVKFLLTIQILQSFMMRMQQKLIWKEIVTPMIQSTNSSIKFLIIGRILPKTLIQLLTKESNRLTFLAEHSTNSHSRRITINFKKLAKIWKYKHWSFCYFLLDQLKTSLSFFIPLELSSFQAFSNKSNDVTETSYKMTVDTGGKIYYLSRSFLFP